VANEIDDAVGEIFAGTEFMTAIAPVEAGGGPLPQAELLSMINHVQGEFIRQDNTVKAFGLLLDSLVELTRSESGIITELRPVKDETRVSVTAASSSLDPAEVRSIYGSADHLTWSKSFRDPFLRELVATRDAVVNNYVNPSASPLRGVKTIVSLPLITGNELIGAVSLMNRQVGYSRALIQQLQPMLRSAANAVEAYRQRQYLAWTERQLNNKANLQRAIMENALDGVIATSQDGTVMDFNPAAERIFGWSKAEVLGRDMGELFFPSEQNATARQAYDDYLESGTAKLMGRHFESRAKRRDGELFPVELAISEVEFDGDVIFVTFARDITKRRAGAAALQAAK
jgi:PAS domain S-box-containing protein